MSVKLTIEVMRKIAQDKDGKCLSKHYVNNFTKLKWECKEGHIWFATPKTVKQGNWCSYCFGKPRLTLLDMKNLAKERGGECLSSKYINDSTKLRWRCKQGHIWYTAAYTVRRGKWCPDCGHAKAGRQRRDTIEMMQEIAHKNGGKCISKKYFLSNKKLEWECKYGHQWNAVPNSIKNGSWCPKCAIKTFGASQRLNIMEMKKIAQAKGGKCLSKSYKNARSKIKWQCKVGHVWGAVPSTVKKGTWCPKCSEGVSERICCKFFEKLFGTNFPKCYPSWLKTSKGHKMELDGYSKKFGIAFEYQGIQHYKAVPYFNRVHDLKEIIKRDKLKRKLCKKQDVHLIQVPYTLDYEDIPDFIINLCDQQGIKVPNDDKKFDHNFFTIYSPEKIKLMGSIAKIKEGKCLSKEYINDRIKLQWQCNKKHIWLATPSNIKRGKWCPYCVGMYQNINDMKMLAKTFGGDCLSQKYLKNNIKLLWQCKEGHKWEDTPAHVKFGRWCSVCARKRRRIK
jgi:hypothetical protein